MSSDLRAVVIKHTARQLGVSEGEVTSDTVIRDIHSLALCVGVETGKIGFIQNIRAKHTVAKAIEFFS
ncbi:hypothetical protein KJ665_01370 [Patescibacteria group bacterium]|nr:hypothetical protein [Patescibacteria group bacterium]